MLRANGAGKLSDPRLQPDNLAIRFGAIITTYRKSVGFTQQEVADGAGLNLRFYQELEEGKALATLPTIERVATVVGWDVCAVLDASPLPDDPANNPPVVTRGAGA
jgi:transcriptional regulator with XRE-family HTH domain